ncbi:MAG TPA: alpha/beta fold hydrolase [Polyangiaceae bacterium]
MTARAARALLFAPGAGAPSSSAWMQAMKRRFEVLGAIECFDYPYQTAGRRSPDKHPVLVSAHEEALARVRASHSGPVVLVGKSMGGRIGCHVAVESADPPAALVCLGYPLVGQNGKVRDEVLRKLATPILFIQGTRDPLCPLAKLEALLPELSAPHALHRVEDGDHSLRVTRGRLAARGETQEAIDDGIVRAMRDFLTLHAS